MSEEQAAPVVEKIPNVTTVQSQQERAEAILSKYSGKQEAKVEPVVAAEAPPEIRKEVVEPTDFSKGFAALAKKEKMLQEKERAWKTERETFSTKATEYDKLSGIMNSAKSKDPAAIKAALSVLGLSAGDVSKMALTDSSIYEDPELNSIKQEIKELKEYRDRKINEEKERTENQQYEGSLGSLKTTISDMIKADADKYDLCSSLGDSLIDHVLAIGDDHYAKNDGEMLPLAKILEMVETNEEQLLERLRTSKKFSKFAGNSATQDASKSGTTSPTLTNTNKSSAPVETTGLTGDARMNAIIKKYQKG